MPSDTVYLSHEKWEYVDSIVDGETIENRSQAIQFIINERRQQEAKDD